MNTDVMFSSKTDQWATPMDFFRELDAEFHFDLDPAADENNHKCDTYFTAKENGLLQSWGGAVTCFVIRHMAGRSESGLKKHSGQMRNMGIWLLCCFRPGQIQNGSMILYTTARKCVLFAGG